MSTRSQYAPIRLPHALILVVLLACCAQALLAQGVVQPARLTLNASPNRVIYERGRKVTLTVTLLDAKGQRLGVNGVAVYLHTTIGTLPAVAYTVNGQIHVLLENDAGPGRAIVTATAGSVQESTTVEFLGQGGSPTAPTSVRPRYRLHGEQVYYGVDQQVFELSGDARFTTPTLMVKAEMLQYSVRDNVLTAQGAVTLVAGERTVYAEKARLELERADGFLITLTPKVSYQRVTLLPELAAVDDPLARDANFQPLDPRPTNTSIVCREATIYPQEQIHFKRPKFFMDLWDRTLLTMPYHVVDLRESSAGKFFNSEVSLTSDAGLDVDFPVYYAANDLHTGALHISQVSQGSPEYRGTEGIQLGLREDYFIGINGEGVLRLDDLARETRSYDWEHHQDFGLTSCDVDASYDRTRDAPYTTRLGLSLTRPIGGVDMSMSSNWRAFQDNQYLAAEVTAGLPALVLGNTGVSLLFSPYAGLRQQVTQIALAPDVDPAATLQETRREYYQGVSLGLGMPVLVLLGGTVTTSLRGDVMHEGDGAFTRYLDADVSYRRPMTKHLHATLTYTYSLKATDENEKHQYLSWGLAGKASNRWGMDLYADYDLEQSALYGASRLTYFLPWDREKNGDRRWFLRYLGNVNLEDDLTADHLISLGRSIGAYTILLHYSPSGNTGATGVGSGTGQDWAIEFVRTAW